MHDDNPFGSGGGGGDRTVLRPTPGGRQAGPIGPSPASAPAAVSSDHTRGPSSVGNVISKPSSPVYPVRLTWVSAIPQTVA